LHSVRLTERSYAVGRSLGDVALGPKVEVTGVRRRGARSEVPQTQYRFETGDILVLLGRPADLVLAEKRLLRG
jgi:CPA2 family monovalent cation:H+ antiporter-2